MAGHFPRSHPHYRAIVQPAVATVLFAVMPDGCSVMVSLASRESIRQARHSLRRTRLVEGTGWRPRCFGSPRLCQWVQVY